MLEEVIGEAHLARFEEGDEAGAAEEEVTFLSPFFRRAVGGMSQDDGADTGRADLEQEDAAEPLRSQFGKVALVFPKQRGALAQRDGIDRIQGAGEGLRLSRHAIKGEVEAMIIHGAEP